MNRPNGEQSGFGSSLVFSTQRGTLKHPYDYYVAFFPPPQTLGVFAVRNGEVSHSHPSETPFLRGFWGCRWEFAG